MTDGPARILGIPQDDLTAEQKKVFDNLVAGRGRLLTPYKIWIHSPELAAAMETIGTFLNKRGALYERRGRAHHRHHRGPLAGRLRAGRAREALPRAGLSAGDDGRD